LVDLEVRMYLVVVRNHNAAAAVVAVVAESSNSYAVVRKDLREVRKDWMPAQLQKVHIHCLVLVAVVSCCLIAQAERRG
jgi:hypothetical protein